ncbi:uncharacterized protein [Prorops nasuta]|uniref:uncharacterized protein n=1 Tax=Prorops nasuta TaxID=863751 RepID=UPI0034CE2E52
MVAMHTIATRSFSQLIMTAEIRIKNDVGKFIKGRALLDTCATANFLTNEMARRLNLPIKACEFRINAIDNIQTFTNGMVELVFYSAHSPFNKKLTCLVLPKISENVPSEVFPREKIKIPANLKLADPQFHVPRGVDLLIGSGATISLFSVGQFNLIPNEGDLYLQKTLIGWVVVGEMPRENHGKIENCQLTSFIKQITSTELNKKKKMLNDMNECEAHYVLNTIRNDKGRYIVRLPFKLNKPDLGDTKIIATRRFHALIRKFKNDSELEKEYRKVMQEYLESGHMTLIESEEEEGYYLPHHAVVKKDSITTKVRVVFDASAKGSKGISLNDILLTGPNIQDKLFEHLVRIRLNKYMITADIEKMYRQILVNKEDRRYQRILWFHQEQIRTFELNTVTFGISSSSFLAIRTLKQLAEDEGDKFPIGAAILKRNLYVDDLMAGADNLDDILKLRNELIALLNLGGFKIRKWSSNHPRAIEFMDEQMSDMEFLTDDTITKKTLGVFWNAKSDELSYIVKPIESNERVTKRIILSTVAKIFDPIGLLGPVIFMAKIIVQECWKIKVSWDESINMTLREKWALFANQLILLNDVTVPRYSLIGEACEVQIHGFCDASKLGYGACIYLRSIDAKGNISVRLICSKSRVASLKEITIPRMELNGALTLARLYKEIRSIITIQIQKIVFWSDSTIVLHWIRKTPISLRLYEANRVTEIQSVMDQIEWRHVRTHENPADHLSRGQSQSEFLNNKTWFEGPSWLKKGEKLWPQSIQITLDNEVGERNESCFIIKVSGMEILKRFSKYSRMIRVIAYCLRFNKNNKQRGSLSNDEINQAEVKILKIVQADRFAYEINCLSNKKEIKSNQIASLSPILNNDGLICVGGRLKNSKIPFNQKCPVLLPARHHVTNLIIRACHEKFYHAGVQSTLYSIRHKFWIPDGRNQVRKIVRNCVRCLRFKPKINNYKMADLPAERVEPSLPFHHVGIDFFGPIFIKEKKYRNRNRIKAYGCVFICMASKAVHIEIANDLSTEAFIAALRRFTGRRGIPAHIYSDNGTNFVGANRELQELYMLLESREFKDKREHYALENKIYWHFNPPLSPHFGGIWEAAVKSFKHHFKRVVGDQLLTLEELNTFTVEIEAILNSRPLCPISSDPNDPLALTPAHLLIGKPLNMLPESEISEISHKHIRAWRLIQKIRLDFWKRWQSEYLMELQKRNKRFYPGQEITVGTIVLLLEKNQPCMHWSIGKIIETHPGDDGIVRVVTVKTSRGNFKRNLNPYNGIINKLVFVFSPDQIEQLPDKIHSLGFFMPSGFFPKKSVQVIQKLRNSFVRSSSSQTINFELWHFLQHTSTIYIFLSLI